MKEEMTQAERSDPDDLGPIWKSIMRKQESLNQILKALALNGPSNVWNLSSLKNVHRGYTPYPWISVKRYLQDLANIGLVESHRRRKVIRGTGSSKLYNLTLFGLISQLLGDKEVEAQREQVLDKHRTVFPQKTIDEIVQLHEFVKELEKTHPEIREELMPNLYNYSRRVLLEDWISAPVKTLLSTLYWSTPDWKHLEGLLEKKPMEYVIRYSLEIVEGVLDSHERELIEARKFVNALRALTNEKATQRPEAPKTEESITEWIEKRFA